MTKFDRIDIELRQVDGCFAVVYQALINTQKSVLEQIRTDLTPDQFTGLAESVESGLARLREIVAERQP